MRQSAAFNLPPWWALALFLILPFLAFPEIIFGGQTLYRTDISWIHYPGHIFMAAEWLAGRVPLWDPYRQVGVPMLAEPQIGVLYPLRALFLSPLSPSLELSLFILFHFSLAAIFTFILARSLQLSTAAATITALSFGFGGFLMAQTPNVNILTPAVWLPLILWATIQAIQRRNWRVALLAGLPLALQILTAHSQITFYTLITLAGYTLYRIITDFSGRADPNTGKFRYALRTALLALLAVASGLLLAAPQLLPSLELLQFTLRSHNQGLDLLTENSLHPLMWLNLLLPSAFGNNVVKFKTGDPFQEVFIYVGFIPLFLALVGLRDLRGQRSGVYPTHSLSASTTSAPGVSKLRFGRQSIALSPQNLGPPHLCFLLLLLGAAWLALGDFTPLYRYVIQYLPGFDLFRIPARWLMVANLALAVLAGFGFDSLLRQGLSGRARWTFLPTGCGLLMGIVLLWLFQADLQNWAAGLGGTGGKLLTAFFAKSFTIDPIYYNERLLLRWVFGLNTPALLLITNILITTILLTLWLTNRLPQTVFTGLLIAALCFDLTLAGGTAINPIKPEQRWAQLSGGARYVLENLGKNRVLPLGVSGEEEAVRNLGQYFPSAYRVRSASGYASPLKLARYEEFMDKAHPVQAIRLLGVRYLLTRGEMGADVASTYPLAFQDEESYVYENKNPLPRAFIVLQAIKAGSPEQALAYWQGLELDPRQTVVLEADSPLPRLSPAASSVTPGTAAITRENPQQIEIATQSATEGYLVLLDTFFPGWVATIDGQITPIYHADYLMRAIYLPAGSHTVTFEYQPASFTWGLWLAAGVVVILLAAVVVKPRPLR
ncbi:MAG: YfhO family protein [Anaerolineae bacterium]